MQDARPRLWLPMPHFPDVAVLNPWFELRWMELWREVLHCVLPSMIADIWTEGQAALMPQAFDGFVEKSKRVSPTCLINFDLNRYSVPASFANRPVSLRIYPERLVVAAEGQILCEQERLIERSHNLPLSTITTGGTIWLSFKVSRGHCAMVLHAPNCQMPSNCCRIKCCANRAAIAIWSTS